jgi:membrane protein required for colicin V production
MHNVSFTLVDVLVVLTVIVSTGFAIWRGFIRETLSIFAWAAAAFATLYFGHLAANLLRTQFPSFSFAPVLGYAGVFLIVLIPLSFISFRFSESVRDSPVGAVDRSLGSAFGVVRGLIIVGMAYLAFSLLVPISRQPDWMTRARLLPVVQESSHVLLSLVPSRDETTLTQQARQPAAAAADTAPVPKPRPSQARPHRLAKTYGAQERGALDKLIETTGDINKP